MIIAVVLLLITGYLSYRSLSSIVSSIHVESKPEMRLLMIRDITQDLEKAENSIRMYTITRDTQDIQPYYSILSGIDYKVNQLRSECAGDTLLSEQVGSISKLIEENIVMWNDILNINNNDRVEKYLKQLSDTLNILSENDKNNEKGILKRVFSRRNKSQLNKQELLEDLTRIEQQDKAMNEKLMTKESQLAVTDSEIRSQFYDLIGKMESEVNGLMLARASEASQLAEKTYRWLVMILLTGALLALLVLFTIFRYARKTYSYQLALEKSKEETEKLARTKEMFMANMSHEIRTPVTAISGFTEQLLHEPHDESTTRTLKIIQSSSSHLARIIDDILDFSKLQTGKLVLDKVHFSIQQVNEDIFALFEKQARRNNTRLSYSLSSGLPPALLGDPYRLKQIMINLIGNALKFTLEGEVHYSIDSAFRKPDEIELIMEFVDTGIGIEESKLKLIFEDFTQAEMSTTRKYGGTGLGLSIVKSIVELHHGSIDCKSRKNIGTKITCRIPFLIGDKEKLIKEEKVPLEVPEEFQKLKILIVDDEEFNRLLFKAILSRWKIPYNEAPSGMEAIEMLKTNTYSLVFMDVRMPGLDGIKTSKFIREELKITGTDMPIVAFSAACTKEDRQKYEKAGMNAFLSKPFTEEMLLATLFSVFKNGTYTPQADIEEEEKKTENEPVTKINLENLYHLASGDNQFARQLLVSFIETTEKGLEIIDTGVKSADWESVAESAHKISPPCRHIGAENLYNMLRQIESNSRNQIDSHETGVLTHDSLQEFETVKRLIHDHLSKSNKTQVNQ